MGYVDDGTPTRSASRCVLCGRGIPPGKAFVDQVKNVPICKVCSIASMRQFDVWIDSMNERAMERRLGHGERFALPRSD